MLKHLCCAFAGLAIISSDASGLTIVRNFIQAGNEIAPGGGLIADDPPDNLSGGGNLQDVFNAAADFWESAIRDPHLLTINYAWFPFDPGIAGIHSTGFVDEVSGRITHSAIGFDSDGEFQFFADPTPRSHTEYRGFATLYDDFGGGRLSTSRIYTDGTDPASRGWDLYSIALHEIGHALGMVPSIEIFRSETADGAIDITPPLPFDGSSLPIRDGGHFAINSRPEHGPLMASGAAAGVRELATHVDLLAIAQLNGYQDIDWALVPEPSSLALFALPWIVWGCRYPRFPN